VSPEKVNTDVVPVLVVCYARPQNLRDLLSRIDVNTRNVYIFIDKAVSNNLEGNREVIEIAHSYKSNPKVIVKCSEVHLGVGNGVPSAIDWAFQFCNELIVLEDDCLPTSHFFTFVETNKHLLGSRIKLLSGTSPWTVSDLSAEEKTTTSSFPLIWGWYTTKNAWANLSKLLKEKLKITEYLLAVIKSPKNISAINFFLAAKIRTDKGLLDAWDSKVALQMLLSDFIAIIPSADLVENIGTDLIASHASSNASNFSGTSNDQKKVSALAKCDFSESARIITDRAIKTNLYGLKAKHLFSPLKARLNLK
jgi:hypothetical protein